MQVVITSDQELMSVATLFLSDQHANLAFIKIIRLLLSLLKYLGTLFVVYIVYLQICLHYDFLFR